MISLHVDVDNLWMYEQEYGISICRDKELIYKTALPRLLKLLGSTNSKATFMIIGKDLNLEACKMFCIQAISQGHEIANHTYSHPTIFSKLTLKQKKAEIRQTHQAISLVCKLQPIGFRSPGYDFDQELVPWLIKLGYEYDSSILPGLAQLLMSGYARFKAGGIKHKSFGRVRDIFSPLTPYPINSLSSKEFLTELPISVLPGVRLPIHTTFAYYFGEGYRQLILRYLTSKPKYVMYLMHAIDFVDLPIVQANHPVIPLRYSYEQRDAFLAVVIDALIRANGGPLTTSRAQIRPYRH